MLLPRSSVRFKSLRLWVDDHKNTIDHVPDSPERSANLLAVEARSPGYSLPARKPCIGREDDVNAIIASLLDHGSQAVTLLGTGGIGKTTVALEVLWDDRVVKSHKQCYFVGCDGATTVPLLLRKLAATLGIETDHDSQQRQAGSSFDDQNVNIRLRARILQVLRSGPAIICLDNFETPWEDPLNSIEVESLLRDIVDIPKLPVLVTMRGTDSPADINWSLLYTLKALSSDHSSQLFQKVSGKSDLYAKKLVKVAGGHPLATSILANLAQGSGETTENLWKRWQRDGTSVSRFRGSKHRLMNLDACFELSLTSHRMRADPNACDVLVLLSLLPDGLSTSHVAGLERRFPKDINLRGSLSTLASTALSYFDARHHPS